MSLPLALLLAAAHSVLAAAAPERPSVATLDLPRFRIHHTPGAAGAAAVLAQTLERERDLLVARMGRDWDGPTQVWVVDGFDEARELAPAGMRPPAWAAGMAHPAENALLLDARVLRREDARQVLVHELAHLGLGRLGGRWPRWFQEGFAMLVAGEWSITRYLAMVRASRGGDTPGFAELTDTWPDRPGDVEVAYAQSLAFVSHLVDERGEERLRDLIGKVAAGEAFDAAFLATWGTPLPSEEARWRKGLRARYTWVPIFSRNATIWGFFGLVFLASWGWVRHRRRERLKQMDLEEQALEAAQRIAAAEAERAGAAPEHTAEDEPGRDLN